VGAAWLVRIAPSDWEADCRGFTWGPAGHAAMLADTARNGARAFDHLAPARAGDAEGISSWRDVAEMLRALNAQTPPPAFASAAELYDEVAIPLGQALARDRSPTRLDSVIAINTRDPAARLVLDLRRDHGRLTTERGPAAELEATLSGDDLLALLQGRLDLARESRTGRLRIRGSLPHALTSLAIIAAWARPHVDCVRHTPMG
jgi:hypothetical protein